MNYCYIIISTKIYHYHVFIYEVVKANGSVSSIKVATKRGPVEIFASCFIDATGDANLSAFAELEYPERHKAVIFEQLEHQKETPRHPANYMAEREVSNIWNSVVVDGENLQETIDKSEIVIDREITRKMQEFGFVDSNGNSIKQYSTILDITKGEGNDKK